MKTNIEELKRLAEAATPGPWRAAISSSMVNRVCTTFETVCETGKNIDDALYITAANPAAVLELIRQRDELLAALRGLVGDVQGLMEESEGVACLHRNGDVAPWSELDAGGRYERLTHLPEAIAAITKAEG